MLTPGMTGRLLGQLVDQWGNLSPATTNILTLHSGVALPPPWDRLSLAHVRALEEAVPRQPVLAYHIAAGLGLPADVFPAEGGLFDRSRYVLVAAQHETWVKGDPQARFELPPAFQAIRSRGDEAKALEILRGLPRHDLNQTLWALYRLDRLHGLLNDFVSGIWLWSNKRRLVEFLTRERLADLTVPVRAVLILAMQKGVTGGVMEEGIVNVLTGTTGADLTRLKGILDRFSPQDLQKLVEGDIDSKKRRRRILDHFAAEAAGVNPDLPLTLWDIDDTLFRNWKDRRYPDDAVYAGVVVFCELLGKFKRNDWERRGPVCVSARPRERLGFVERFTVEALRERGLAHPTVLSAGLLNLIRGIAHAKLENFVSYHRLTPEFKKVLFGDNGQSDEEFFRRAIVAHPEAVIAAFLHDVSEDPPERLAGYTYETIETEAGERRIYSYDTYIGAALAVYESDLSLLSLSDLRTVVGAALAEVERVPFDSDSQKAAAKALLERDRQIVERKYPLSPA